METIGDAIITVLQAQLPAELNRIDALQSAADITKFGFALTLDDIPNSSYYFGFQHVCPQFPALFVVPDSLEFADVRDYRPHTIHIETQKFTIEFFVADDQAETCERRAQRYARAIANILQKNHKLSNAAKGGKINGMQYRISADTNGGLFRTVILNAEYTVLVET